MAQKFCKNWKIYSTNPYTKIVQNTKIFGKIEKIEKSGKNRCKIFCVKMVNFTKFLCKITKIKNFCVTKKPYFKGF